MIDVQLQRRGAMIVITGLTSSLAGVGKPWFGIDAAMPLSSANWRLAVASLFKMGG
jgi:hypothetical protein